MDKYREKEDIRENEADKDKIYGRNAVIEAIKSGREIDKIMVAKGATNAAVRLNIVRTVQVLLGVTYDKIEVFAYKS